MNRKDLDIHSCSWFCREGGVVLELLVLASLLRNSLVVQLMWNDDFDSVVQ